MAQQLGRDLGLGVEFACRSVDRRSDTGPIALAIS
jgi:hypothetical protein